MEETFRYDKMNRLIDIFLGSTQSQICYDPIGRMTSKQADGQCVFTNASFTGAQGQPARPHAMKSAETTANVFPAASQAVTYTSFDKLRTLAQDGKTLSIDYDINRQRIKQTYSDGSTTRTKRYFTPLYESVTENGVTKKLHYLTAGTGLFAIFFTQNNGGGTMHYTLKDHQGNLTATVCGSDVERLSYDAWGRRRNTTEDSDIRWAKTVYEKNPNAVFKIYFKNSYYEYDGKGLLTIPEMNTTKDIEVFDNYIKP